MRHFKVLYLKEGLNLGHTILTNLSLKNWGSHSYRTGFFLEGVYLWKSTRALHQWGLLLLWVICQSQVGAANIYWVPAWYLDTVFHPVAIELMSNTPLRKCIIQYRMTNTMKEIQSWFLGNSCPTEGRGRFFLSQLLWFIVYQPLWRLLFHCQIVLPLNGLFIPKYEWEQEKSI